MPDLRVSSIRRPCVENDVFSGNDIYLATEGHTHASGIVGSTVPDLHIVEGGISTRHLHATRD
jgi:hypothetical protein